MIRIILAALLAASPVANAQNDDPIAGLGMTLSEVNNSPWGRGHHDPLTSLVSWGNTIDPSICWVGRPPNGWGYVSNRYKLKNETDGVMVLDLDGEAVDVMRAQYAGGGQLPAMVIARTSSGLTKRYTALMPGETCYSVLTNKPGDSRWEIHGTVLSHLGAPGPDEWLNTGKALLYTAPLIVTRRVATEDLRQVSGRVGFAPIFKQYQI